MTRDMDLIRELLLKLESLPLPAGAMTLLSGYEPELAVEGYSGDQIQYHLDLLREAGLIESPGSQPALGVTFRRLSFSGHDFLDSVRSPETWKRPKRARARLVIGASISFWTWLRPTAKISIERSWGSISNNQPAGSSTALFYASILHFVILQSAGGFVKVL